MSWLLFSMQLQWVARVSCCLLFLPLAVNLKALSVCSFYSIMGKIMKCQSNMACFSESERGFSRSNWTGSVCSRMNLAPTVGYEEDAGSRTTHHFMYPESAKNLAANVSFVLVPFKTLDLLWITSALSTGQIRLWAQ